MIIALVARHLSEWDAIGNDLLGMARVLTDLGQDVRIYAEKSRIRERVLPVEELRNLSHRDIVIYHHANRWDAIVPLLKAHPGRVILRYHNITPGHFFRELDPQAMRDAELGKRQALTLASLAEAIWTPSSFNGRELEHDSVTVPPFHQVDALLNTRADSDTFGGLDDWATTIVSVGRVAPNKNLNLALEAFGRFRQLHDSSARLVLVGEHSYQAYSDQLQLVISREKLQDAVIPVGRVNVAQLKAIYHSADALLITSEHEGFCVPLVEAMALAVPIVVKPTSAIPETAGDSALFGQTPAELADALQFVIGDVTVREQQIHRGMLRYQQCFTTEQIQKQWVERLEADLDISASEPVCVNS